MNIFDYNPDVLIWIFRIMLAGLCGFFIGLERESRSKEAGVRTHTIVAMASALIMVVSKYGFADVYDSDASRIAAQIVSGIGFLGAGIIIYRRDILRGVTTAAGIWATAGIGMAMGSGLCITGLCFTILLIIIQILLHMPPFKALKESNYSTLKAQIVLEDEKTIDNFQTLFKIYRILRIRTYQSEGKNLADIEFITPHIYSLAEFYDIMSANGYIKSIERFEED
ncbi:MAG TPA: MgtC/SapB family protein [Clostridiales bacterium]|nr:MgtC/SapB family protein [Clostridiales bacterium]